MCADRGRHQPPTYTHIAEAQRRGPNGELSHGWALRGQKWGLRQFSRVPAREMRWALQRGCKGHFRARGEVRPDWVAERAVIDVTNL